MAQPAEQSSPSSHVESRTADESPEALRARIDRLIGGFGGTAASAIGIVLFVVALSAFELAVPSIRTFGVGFLSSQEWDPIHARFGALPFLYGTFVTSAVALALAVPVGLGMALFLSDLGPSAFKRPVGTLMTLLAAVPSVVYGLWAALVLAPLLRTTIEPALEARFGSLPFFRGPSVGVGLFCAALVLAVMVLPTIASVSREVLRAVPWELREGALALGATRWDVVRRVVLPHARAGLSGAVLLGFGRAASEAMAVAMVVGSRPEIRGSLFAPGYTMSSVIANEFAESTGTLHVAALAEIGLLLFAVTLTVNVVARMLVSRVRGT